MSVRLVMRGRTITGRQRALLRWYRAHGRHQLPWRRTRDPYAILVSEVMLQQTQVDRVVSYFEQWMRRWPTIEALARAKRASVIRAWAGLGYNRRAVYLHELAQRVVGDGRPFACQPWLTTQAKRGSCSPDVEVLGKGSPLSTAVESGDHQPRMAVEPHGHARGTRRDTQRGAASVVGGPHGKRRSPPWRKEIRGGGLSECAESLQRLPGVGPYTANALLAFAWNVPAPCVDTNVRRVLAYAIYQRPAIMRMPLQQVERLAARVIPPDRGRDWNYALMDYGALVLRARDIPKCPTLSGVGQRRREEPFAGSSCFWRGRIVAVLREARRPRTIVELRRALAQVGDPSRALAPLLRALERDGVIVRRAGQYQLA